MKLENGSSGQTLIGNMSNNMQLRQALNLADNNPGMTDDKLTRLQDAQDTAMRTVQNKLADDPRYGPEAAAAYPRLSPAFRKGSEPQKARIMRKPSGQAPKTLIKGPLKAGFFVGIIQLSVDRTPVLFCTVVVIIS